MQGKKRSAYPGSANRRFATSVELGGIPRFERWRSPMQGKKRPAYSGSANRHFATSVEPGGIPRLERWHSPMQGKKRPAYLELANYRRFATSVELGDISRLEYWRPPTLVKETAQPKNEIWSLAALVQTIKRVWTFAYILVYVGPRHPVLWHIVSRGDLIITGL
jgi:hypothetical protein